MKRTTDYLSICIILFCVITINSCTFSQTENKEDTSTLLDRLVKRANEISDSFERDGNSQYIANSGTFNISEPKYQRFVNSPCYNKIGLRIFDLENLENEYQSCEKEYYFKYYVLFSFIIFVLITIIIVAILKKRTRKRKNLADKIKKLKDGFFMGDYSTKMKALEELRSKNILSEKEFIDKVSMLYDSYSLDVNKQKAQKIIIQLEKGVNTGIFTQEEFTKKMKELHTEKK